MDAVTGSVAGRPRGDPYAPSQGHFYSHRVATSVSYVGNRFKLVLQPTTSRHKFQRYTGFTPGRPATAVRSSNRPALLVGQHLTGWKGLAVPYDAPEWGHFLRAEGYSRRCGQFEFVAAQQHP